MVPAPAVEPSARDPTLPTTDGPHDQRRHDGRRESSLTTRCAAPDHGPAPHWVRRRVVTRNGAPLLAGVPPGTCAGSRWARA